MSGSIDQARIADLGHVTTTEEQREYAAAYVKRNARDEDDRAELLAALKLEECA